MTENLIPMAGAHNSRFVVYHCPSCAEPTNFLIDGVHTVLDAAPPDEYSFAHCSKCNNPAMFVREDMGDGFENDFYVRVYPPHDRHIGFYLPVVVRESYEEAVRCETANAWIASVVMVGRTLEAVVKEYDPNEKSAYKGLQTMQKNGVISQELLDWSNELRVLRNIGAHASSQKVEQVDAKESLDFLQAILEILYDLRPRFVKMRNRRKSP